MSQSPKERRHGWTPDARERLSGYEREWTRPHSPEEIREQYHDDHSRTIERDLQPTGTPRRATKPSVTSDKPRAKSAIPSLTRPVIPADYCQTRVEPARSMLWNHKTPTAKPRPAEPLFEFTRASDRRPITCELRFNSESYGWEVRFLDRGGLWYSRGAFAVKELAVAWAWQKRTEIEG